MWTIEYGKLSDEQVAYLQVHWEAAYAVECGSQTVHKASYSLEPDRRTRIVKRNKSKG